MGIDLSLARCLEQLDEIGKNGLAPRYSRDKF